MLYNNEKLLLNEMYFTMHKSESIIFLINAQNKRLKAAKLCYSQTAPYVSSHTTTNQQNRISHNVHSWSIQYSLTNSLKQDEFRYMDPFSNFQF